MNGRHVPVTEGAGAAVAWVNHLGAATIEIQILDRPVGRYIDIHIHVETSR